MTDRRSRTIMLTGVEFCMHRSPCYIINRQDATFNTWLAKGKLAGSPVSRLQISLRIILEEAV